MIYNLNAFKTFAHLLFRWSQCTETKTSINFVFKQHRTKSTNPRNKFLLCYEMFAVVWPHEDLLTVNIQVTAASNKTITNLMEGIFPWGEVSFFPWCLKQLSKKVAAVSCDLRINNMLTYFAITTLNIKRLWTIILRPQICTSRSNEHQSSVVSAQK